MSLIEYDIQGMLGRGCLGEVYLGRHKIDAKLYAIKKVTLASAEERALAAQEARSLLDIKHANVIIYKASFLDHLGCLNIISKFAPGGDLACVIENQRMNNDFISEREVMAWSVQIFMALKYLHKSGIIHKNLKPQNIFLDRAGIIKVGDLGIAKVLESKSSVGAGTQCYTSPELVTGKPFTHKSDVWALGCCMYELVALRLAFDGEDMIALELKILHGKTQRMPFLYSKRLRDLIEEMLRKHSKSRPSIRSILNNEYVKSHVQRVWESLSVRNSPRQEIETKRGGKRGRIPDMEMQNYGLIDIHERPDQNELDVRAKSENSSNILEKSGTSSKCRAHQYEEGLPARNDNERREKAIATDRRTRNRSDKVPFLLPHHQAYDPRKYADTVKMKNFQTICSLSPRSRLGKDSGYGPDITAPLSTPLGGSHMLLDSSTRFYPIPTLRWSEGEEKDASENRIIEFTSSSDFPRVSRANGST